MFNKRKIRDLEIEVDALWRNILSLSEQIDSLKPVKRKRGRPTAKYGLKKDGTPKKKPGPKGPRNKK